MSIFRLHERGINPSTRQKGILKDWCLKFNKKASAGDWSFANIEPMEGNIVEGIVFEIKESDLNLLDKFEGAPKHYRREFIKIETENSIIECITYIAQSEHIVEGLSPKKEYLDFLIKGSGLLSDSYQDMLKSLQIIE